MLMDFPLSPDKIILIRQINWALIIHRAFRSMCKALYCVQTGAGHFGTLNTFALFPPVLFSLEYSCPWSHCPLCSSQLPDAASRVCPGPAEHPEVVALTSVTIWCFSCPTVVTTLIVAHIACACSWQFMWIWVFWTKNILPPNHVCLNLLGSFALPR